MDSDSKPHRRSRSPPSELMRPLKIRETEIDLDSIVTNVPSATAAPLSQPIATIANTGSGDSKVTEMGITGPSSPSNSSDGSSSGFVKVEHSDVQQGSDLTVDDLTSIRMEQLLRQHTENHHHSFQDHPAGTKMNNESDSDEPPRGILPRAQEFVGSTFGKVAQAASAGAEEVAHGSESSFKSAMDAANAAMHTACNTIETAGGVLGDPIHLDRDTLDSKTKHIGERMQQTHEGFTSMTREGIEKASDTVKEVVGHIGETANKTYKGFGDSGIVENAEDTVSDILMGAAHGNSDMGQAALDTAVNMTQTVKEDVVKAMDTVIGELDDATHVLVDTADHIGDSFGGALQKAKESATTVSALITDAASKSAHSAEDTFVDLGHRIEESLPQVGSSNKAKHLFDEQPVKHNESAYADADVANEQETQNWDNNWGKVGIKHAEEEDAVTHKLKTDFGNAEESIFERSGPLTIPSEVTGDAQRLDDEIDSSGLSGFEVSPRPPTPPKALDDEDVKPTIIDVGQPASRLTPGSTEHPRSILKHSAQSSRYNLKWMNSNILDLVYWRDPKKSGAILGTIVLTLLVFAKLPLVAVLSYLGLAVLGGTLGFRIYKLIESQIKKTDSCNPFQPYLHRDFHLPQEKVHQQVDVLIEHAQLVGNELKRLFLVEDIVDSVKFGLLLWALTYVSCWFSGLCILILLVLALFTIPKVYEVYQEPIDRNVSVAKQHIDNITKKINDKVPPFLKKSAAEVSDISHEKSN